MRVSSVALGMGIAALKIAGTFEGDGPFSTRAVVSEVIFVGAGLFYGHWGLGNDRNKEKGRRRCQSPRRIGLQKKLPWLTKSGWRVPARSKDGDATSDSSQPRSHPALIGTAIRLR